MSGKIIGSRAARAFLDWADANDLTRYTVSVTVGGVVFASLIRDTLAEADRVRLLVPWESDADDPQLPEFEDHDGLGSARGAAFGCDVEVISKEGVPQ